VATQKGGAGGDKKGKKAHKNKKTGKKYKSYAAKSKRCPRCGPGVYLASHKDRSYCGKCHFTEFVKKEA